MAHKRMFDKAILETDAFLNVSLTAKAIYFLLGMECDDEGFVSPTRVLRLYGGEIGDIKNLIDVGLVLRFKSGVLVITDWHQNNYLDRNRIKATQHQTERQMLRLTEYGKYEFNGCSTSIEQRSIEEYRGEEKADKPPTPSEVAKSFFEGGEHYKKMIETYTKPGNEAFLEKEMKKFCLYWTEPNKSGTKVRWQQESTFEVKRRLLTWLNRAIEYRGTYQQKKPNIIFS